MQRETISSLQQQVLKSHVIMLV